MEIKQIDRLQIHVAERLRELIGETKHRAHLNYLYGVTVEEEWGGLDVPDFPGTKPPDYAPPLEGGVGLERHDGVSPFVMQADGKGWLYCPSGLKEGPLPTHYEPAESVVENALWVPLV